MARILIVGTGFAGMWAALGAARAQRDLGSHAGMIDIDVVAPTSLLCLKPRLYERRATELEVDIAPLLAAMGVTFRPGTVEAIDAQAKSVTLRDADGRTARLPYDALILATGSHTAPPPAAWQRFLHVLDGATQAMDLRRHIEALPRRPRSTGRFVAVVVGAGFTGLEIATELAGWLRELADAAGETASVVLLDRAATPGATLGDGPQAAISAALSRTGVTFRPSATVQSIDTSARGETIVRVDDGSSIEAATVVWAAGLRAHPLAQAVGRVDADGRLAVDAALRVEGQAAIFAAGDMARAVAAPGHDTLMSCQHAMPTGRVAGHNAVRLLAGVEPITYSQPMYVTCLDLGDAGALFAQGWDRAVLWTGGDAKAVKRLINGRLIAPPPAGNPELALQLADPTPLPVAEPDALVARWRAMLDAAGTKAR